jgi:hypothetical protein
MKQVLLLILTLTTIPALNAQQQQDREAILSMGGCYEVTFNFAETFSPDPDYEFHENYRSGGLEYVFPIVNEEDQIILQHLLIVRDSMIIKHWRQDWLYENTKLYVYDRENTWQFEQLDGGEVSGQWSQKVFQVDDGPRYEGTGSWIHADGRSYWEAYAAAPLPRREFSKRDDYNVMKRRNRQEITEYGWVHEQDNDKIKRTGQGDQLIAQEKGWNTYERTEDSRCQVAADWWKAHEAYWANVRKVWDELFAGDQAFHIRKRVDDKVLFMDLFALQDEVKKKDLSDSAQLDRIRGVMDRFIVTDLSALPAELAEGNTETGSE